MASSLIDLLDTVEALTVVAEQNCSVDMDRTLALIEQRAAMVTQLVTFIDHGAVLTLAEFERLRNAETSGARLVYLVQLRRQQLLEQLSRSALQRSFADCVTGALNLRPYPQSFDL